MPRGGTRAGAGRPTKDPKISSFSARLTDTETRTLGGYRDAQTISLLASGLRLAQGNVGELSADEWTVLDVTLSGTVLDALTVRHLRDEVAEAEHPGAAALAARMANWGDWEMMHVVLAWQSGNWAANLP